MSLINEALKKAQRQRGDQHAATDAGGDGPVEKRGAPMRAQSLLIMVAGAAVLIVFSVVVTVYLVNRRPPQLATSAPPAPKQVIRTEPSDLSPIVVAPIVTPAPATQAPAATERAPVAVKAVEPTPEPKTVPSPVLTETPVPRTEAPASAPSSVAQQSAPLAAVPAQSAPDTAPAVSNAPFDPRALAFVDAIKVTGIRSSGNESKVLMNDRVYRVNDIVDRSLNLKLIKVEADTLTFTDPNGAVYTKNF